MIDTDNFNHEASTEELPNHYLLINELAADLQLPEDAINDEDIQFASRLLDEAYANYSDPSSPYYKHYHNTEHDFYVLRRAWSLWADLRREMPDQFDEDGFKLLLFSVSGHDYFVDPGTPEGKDEKRSGKFTARRMIGAGYSHEDACRVREAIDTTAVQRDEDGHVTQYNIRSGSKDPLKFVLAYADINGVPMEGVPTMMRDATNLYLENSGDSIGGLLRNPKKAVGIMLSQAGFVQDRLDAMDGDIAYYFDEEEQEIVRNILDGKYSKTSREALALATNMKKSSDFAEFAIRKTLESTGKGAHNISSVPAKITRSLLGRDN